MTTAVMTERIAEVSPRFKAREDAFYLLTMLTRVQKDQSWSKGEEK